MSRPPRRHRPAPTHAHAHAHAARGLRIVGGFLGGRRIGTIGDRRVRPMPDRMRTALFNALDSRDRIAGTRVLDAFAGSGAMGIEAISRGAAHATFFERDRDILAQLQTNLAALELGPEVARVISGDVLADGPAVLLPHLGRQTSAPEAASSGMLIFLDPPYDYLREPFAAEFISRTSNLLARLAPEPAQPGEEETAGPVCIVLGHDFDVEIPGQLARFTIRETREYGRTRITFYGDWD